ncbi:MAG: metal ABC transporter permease [Alphaproteobacteria bacterium]
MTLDTLLIEPFEKYAFLRRALVACVTLAVGGAPLGFFMNQRRMALVSDAMSHAIFPGVAIAFLISGFGVWSLTIGGLTAGTLIALFSVFLSRYTQIKEDAVFTMLFLLSLTSGIVLLSLKGSNIDLMHMLFGDILAIDSDGLIFITGVTILTLFTLTFIYRGLVLDCFDPDFLKASGRGKMTRQIFFVLFVVNLVAAFQALGTLMALGLMLLPAIASSFWTRRVNTAIPLSIGIAMISSYVGLLISYYTNTPSGPVVVLFCAVVCLGSVLFGRQGSFIAGLQKTS